MKYIITTDNQEQGWLDSFNGQYGHTYQMNQEVQEEHLDQVEWEADVFNHTVAEGPAILINEVAK